jgi:NAD(P)-dependent dehydrogenase (short-subunit alcohol dehydrogenase family)
MRLAGKVALVTGAAGGIGAAIVNLFRAEGATVIATDLADPDGTDGVEPLDVTQEATWRTVGDRLASAHGRLDILVHNAGISGFVPLADLEEAAWHRFLDTNVGGAYLGTRVLMPLLEVAPTGSIVAIGSTLALRPASALPAYSASKGALRNLIKSIALDCANRGTRIRANSVHPGSTETPLMAANMAGNPEGRGRRMAVHPLSKGWNELIQPDDVAKAVLFLASDESRMITGIDLPVDAGATI